MALISNKETVAAAAKKAQEFLTKYKTQRSEYEKVWKVADYMKNAAQNRTINSSEKVKGADLDDNSEQANTGSTLFKRQVAQLASQGYAVQASKEVPFKYVPISSGEELWSPEEAKAQADQRNLLARWTMKQDGFNVKSIDFWDAIYTYGNVPVMVYQKTKRADVKISVPVYGAIEGPDGNATVATVGYDEKIENRIVENFPSIKMFPVDSLYADALIGNLPHQECVIIASLKTRGDLLAGMRAGDYDEDKVKEVLETEGPSRKHEEGPINDVAIARLDNRGIDNSPVTAAEQYHTFDVLMRCPLEGEKWDEESMNFNVYWLTFVGTRDDISGGTCIRFDDNPDPLDEIPIEMIHCYPDSEDMLYHVSPAQIVRSNYSVECTLKNLAIDNCALQNRPPLKVMSGTVYGVDGSLKFSPNQLFVCERSLDDIEPMFVSDNTSCVVNLLEYIVTDTQRALATDKPFMGESFGARTSATEADNVMKSSMQPHLMGIRYVMEQYLRFYARKLSSYWDAYALPGQHIAITDSVAYPVIKPGILWGEFDIEIDIVDEFEHDVVERQHMDETIKLIGTVPAFQSRVDMTQLLIMWMQKRKIDYSRIVRPPTDTDADDVAMNENIAIMQGIEGVARVLPTQNHDVHIRVHSADRMRYRGVEEQFPAVEELDQHIEEHKMQQQNAQQGGQGTPEGATNNQSPGEVAGNEMAGAMGAEMGGGLG